MQRRAFLKSASVAAGGIALAARGAGSAGQDQPGSRPNLVFVFPDQMRGQAMGFLDEDPVVTPNLDRFASESLVLTQAASNYPVCSPYRGIFMTGMYPHAYGTYDHHLRPLYWAGDAARDGFHYVDQWGPEHEADKAIEYIQNADGALRDPDRPFALVVSMNPPHTPYSAHPEKYDAAYADKDVEELCTRANIPGADTRWGKHYRKHIRDYFASITGVDDQFGRFVRAVDEAGLGEDTIIVFTSDHGDCVGIHNEVTKNNHYEESMRVPFLIRWKGRIEPRQDDLLLSTPDVYPTLLDLMGCGDQIPPDLHGRSHASLFQNGEGHRPTSQPYLWVPVGEPAWGRRGIRTHRYTLEISHLPDELTHTILHDNQADPYQLKNIAAEQPDIVEQLIRDELRPWLDRVCDPWIQHLGEG